jgi:putative nucleotidyltransferase with HDIG domain
MSLHPNLEEQEALAETFQHQAAPIRARELAGEFVLGIGFVAATAGLWILHPPHGFVPVPALLCLAVFVAAAFVHIDTPFGFTPPTQLAFVPLVFAMPLAAVPVAVAVGMAVTRLPAVLRREVPATRLLLYAGNSWFAIGPVAVFLLSGTRPATAGAFVLVGALLAQFAVDFAISSVRLVIARGISVSANLCQLWVDGIDAGLSCIALVVAKHVRSEPASVLALVPLLGILAVFARERHQRLKSLLELNNAYRGTALVLGDVVEADDGYTGEHCKSVVELTLAVANRMGLDAERRRNLEFAALLHDIGKIVIPNEIINKPGKLDRAEWALMQTHTTEGQKMLDRVGGFMREVGRIVRSHHEQWDGSGYPDGLAGEAIPVEARIIACCDAWNAMRTDRSYRKALSHEVAMAELVNNVGSQFDPAIAAALIPIVAAEAPAEPVGAVAQQPAKAPADPVRAPAEPVRALTAHLESLAQQPDAAAAEPAAPVATLAGS